MSEKSGCDNPECICDPCECGPEDGKCFGGCCHDAHGDPIE